jgi:hypothetical protein
MRAMCSRCVCSPHCDPKTGAPHGHIASGARNLEQTPERRRNYRSDHNRKNKPDDEVSWSGSHQGAGQKQKNKCASRVSVAPAPQILANCHWTFQPTRPIKTENFESARILSKIGSELSSIKSGLASSYALSSHSNAFVLLPADAWIFAML